MTDSGVVNWVVGEQIGPLHKPPITRLQLVKYAGASGDFNPIHTIDEFAQQAGLGSVIAHGMLTMAFVGQMLTDAIGQEGEVRSFGVRFTGMVRPGDVITCTGEITSVTAGNEQLAVTCHVVATTQNEERVVEGHAEVVVPQR